MQYVVSFLLFVPLFMVTAESAPADDKRAKAEDLSKVHPPGGAPLRGNRGTAITADVLERVGKRLESAPVADLDKWLNELERITGRKFDKELDRGGCRTYFAIRMSVAFDDLTWDAKAADKLFGRIQTIPPAEAKAWKEAFEAAVKNDFGPAYTVPLVLVPVDALFDGEKYSAEQGKKSRARLAQFTADAVSLWQLRVDRFEGTKLDAAMNMVLRDEFFYNERHVRDRFKVAVGLE